MADDFSLGKRYELHSSDKGLVLITSEIRMDILKELSSAKLTLADLSRNLGVSQSTLATNLSKMTDDGIITSEPDQIDSRKVYYALNSSPVFSSKEPDPEALEMAHKVLEDASLNPKNFYRDMMLNLSLKTQGNGIDLGPMFEHSGYDLGVTLYNNIESVTIEDLIINIKKYFNEAGIGDLNVFTFVPLTLTLQNEDIKTEAARDLLLKFLFGLFKAILKCHTDGEYVIKSSEVFGNGIMKFTVDLAPKK